MRRDPQVLAGGGRLVVTLTVLVALLPAAAAPPAPAAASQPSSGQGSDRLQAEAQRALARWDAHQVTIEDAAEQINAVTQQVDGLQARIGALEELRRSVGSELVGADGTSGQDPVAGVRSLAARFFNSFATGLAGASAVAVTGGTTVLCCSTCRSRSTSAGAIPRSWRPSGAR